MYEVNTRDNEYSQHNMCLQTNHFDYEAHYHKIFALIRFLIRVRKHYAEAEVSEKLLLELKQYLEHENLLAFSTQLFQIPVVLNTICRYMFSRRTIKLTAKLFYIYFFLSLVPLYL